MAAAGYGLPQGVRVTQITVGLLDLEPLEVAEIAVAAHQDADFDAVLQQTARHSSADEAGGASDERFHRCD
jgi:hypothetical protein